jgi:hypothetical protein
MKLTNPWVGYLDRSYKTIKASILTRIRVTIPELTDLSDSNILVIIISIFSGIAEQLNYYIDTAARELFLTTAKRTSSVYKISQLLNYSAKARTAASVDLLFTTDAPVDNPDLVIPIGTVVTSDNGFQFITTKTLAFTPNTSKLIVPAKQRVTISPYTITNNTQPGWSIPLPPDYEHGSAGLQVDGIAWTLRETLAFSRYGSADFKVIAYQTEGDDGTIGHQIQVGDGLLGMYPEEGTNITISYCITYGRSGNYVPALSINTIQSSITIPVQDPAVTLSVTNPLSPRGGTDVEGRAEIVKYAPLSLKTLDRAVTRQDYIDIAKLAPGVDKAALHFNCGKYVTIYVAPTGGGIAPDSLLGEVQIYFDSRKMVTTLTSIKAAGETFISMEIQAVAKFRVDPTLARRDIEEALITAYSESTSDINKPVRLSDIIALVDNLDKVDYLTVHNLSAIPYARPVGHDQQLSWNAQVGPSSVEILKWKLIFTGGVFKLYKGIDFVSDIASNAVYDIPGLLTIQPIESTGTPFNGMYWEFYTYPFNTDIVLQDYTVPRIDPYMNYINLTVTGQSYING